MSNSEPDFITRPFKKKARPALAVVAVNDVSSEVLRQNAARTAKAAARKLDEELSRIAPKYRTDYLRGLLKDAPAGEWEALRQKLEAAEAEWEAILAKAQTAIDWHGQQSGWHRIEARRLEREREARLLGLYSF